MQAVDGISFDRCSWRIDRQTDRQGSAGYDRLRCIHQRMREGQVVAFYTLVSLVVICILNFGCGVPSNFLREQCHVLVYEEQFVYASPSFVTVFVYYSDVLDH